MPKKKAKKTKLPEPEIRSDTQGWQGGLPINLDRELKSGGTLRDKLTADVARWLEQEKRNQEPLIERLAEDDKQYRGIKPEKSDPFPGTSNVAIPRTRIDVDAVTVRIFDVIWGQAKLAIIKPLEDWAIQLAPNLEDGIEWWQKEIAHLKDKLFSPILQAVKSGTGAVKVIWEKQKNSRVRYATQEEIDDENIKTFKLKDGGYGIKVTHTVYDSPNVYGLPREDLVVSSDATTMDDAFLVAFKYPLREEEIRDKIRRKVFCKEVKDCLEKPDKPDETKEARIESQKKEIRPDEYGKFWPYEIWLRYDVDDDGIEDSVVITYHEESGKIWGAIYNPYFSKFRPIEKLVSMPSEYSFEGVGLCEKLRPLQEAIDTVFNMRFDRLKQINLPITIVKADAGLDDFELEPGKTWWTDTDVEGAIREVPFHPNYPETERMEMALNSYADQTAGIGPANLGQPTAERPVARETYMLIQEVYKGIKFQIDNIRDWIARIIMKALEMVSQYRPSWEYYIESEGRFEKRTLDFPLEYLRDGISIQLAASSEVLNQEVRREIGLTIWTLLSEYMTRVASMAQVIVSPGVPADFKMVLLEANKIGVYLMKQIIRDFGLIEEEHLVLDIEKAINVQKALSLPEQMPMPMPQQGQGQPQGGQPKPGM